MREVNRRAFPAPGTGPDDASAPVETASQEDVKALSTLLLWRLATALGPLASGPWKR